MGPDDDRNPAQPRAAPRFDLEPAFGLGEGDDAWLDLVNRALRPLASIGRIGPYELLEELGHGGQGTVYRSVQPETGRFIAIKRVSGATGADDRDRFRREVTALARLEHPNVVTVYGADVIGDCALLLMQLVRGVPIDRWADAAVGRRGWVEQVLAGFVQVCDGVEHAHQRGVIHRDIKPSNILVDSTDVPHVLDFGIARILDATAAARERADPATIGFAGTPTYAAPERLAGGPADTRGDVYSLGVLLYRLLVGADPFADAARAGGLNALVVAVREGAAARPSALRADVPRELDWIVQRAMACEPEGRYRSVRELADDVRRSMTGDAVEAHPPTLGYRIRTTVRRHRWPIAVAVLVATALTAVTVVSWRSAVRVSEALAQTRDALGNESKSREIQAEVIAFMRDVLGGSDPGSRTGRPDMTVREALDGASQRLLEGGTPRSPEVEAAIRLEIAKTYVNIGVVEPAMAHVRAALELQTSHFGANAPETLEPRHQLARLYRASGKLDLSAAMHREIVDLRRAQGAAGRKHLAQALVSLAITLRHLKQYDEAEAALREALAIYSEELGPTDENIGQVLASLATLMGTLDRMPEAEAFGRHAVTVARANHPDHPHHDLAAAMCNLATVLCRRGNVAEGEPMMREGLAMHRAVSGEHHIMSAQAAMWLGAHLADQGRFDESAPLLESALNGFTALYPPGHQAIAAAAERLRAALDAAGRASEAETPLEPAVRSEREHPP